MCGWRSIEISVILQSMSGKTAGWNYCTRDTLVTLHSSQQPLWNLPSNISAWSLGLVVAAQALQVLWGQSCCCVLPPAAPEALWLGGEPPLWWRKMRGMVWESSEGARVPHFGVFWTCMTFDVNNSMGRCKAGTDFICCIFRWSQPWVSPWVLLGAAHGIWPGGPAQQTSPTRDGLLPAPAQEILPVSQRDQVRNWRNLITVFSKKCSCRIPHLLKLFFDLKRKKKKSHLIGIVIFGKGILNSFRHSWQILIIYELLL